MKYLNNEKGEVVAAVSAIFFLASLIMWGVIGHNERAKGIDEGKKQCTPEIALKIEGKK